jgi:hypothetical protein
MIIEIDDSGTGDLIGDAFIGFLKRETNELRFKAIPLEMFNEENWKNKMPFKFAVELVKIGLRELKFNKEKDKIVICRGNFFDEVRSYFEEEGILYEAVTIEGKLQDAVEQKLVDHLRNDIGVKSKMLTKDSGARRYFVLFNWLCQDFYKREKYVKNGFNKWKTYWREIAIEKYEKKKNQKNSMI